MEMCCSSSISRAVVYELVSAGFVGGMLHWSGEWMEYVLSEITHKCLYTVLVI